MTDPISISKTLRIRACGLDEFWLQDQIFNNPSILGLGELEPVRRERRQSSGGRLDLLLTDPEDDTMYEVEVMLGATDESHIIRTIEYWDLEKRRWPQRQHYAVLVAESVTNRFFNVIQLLSLSIPVIAIQANIIEADGKRILHFVKVLDAYEEPEDDLTPVGEAYDEGAWLQKSPMTVACAKAFYASVRPALPTSELKYFKFGLTVVVGSRCYFWFRHKDAEKSLFGVWVDETRNEKAVKLLEKAGLLPFRKKENLHVLLDSKTIQDNAGSFQQLGPLVEESWRDKKGVRTDGSAE